MHVLPEMVCQVKLFRELFSVKALELLLSGTRHVSWAGICTLVFNIAALRVEELLQFWTLKLEDVESRRLQSCVLNCRTKLYKIFL